MEFELFNELGSIKGQSLYLLIGSAFVALLLTAFVLFTRKHGNGKVSRGIVGALLGIVVFMVVYVLVMISQSLQSIIDADSYAGIDSIISFDYSANQNIGRFVISGILGMLAVLIYFVWGYFAADSVKEGQVSGMKKYRHNSTRALVYAALCVSVAFVLSYMKLFTLPFEGSITLFSMLPIMLYACWFGPAYGFSAAFAYAILQVVQGAYIVHWAQFMLDYILGFTVLGFAAFFPKNLPIGILVAGALRMACSTVSGVIFFAEYAEGWSNVWVYSLVYNGMTIGVDTVLCFIVSLIPPVGLMFDRLKKNAVI